MVADKELRKLSRLELIDIIYQLRLENAELEKCLDDYRNKLSERAITISKSGSIAKAALELNGLFEAAQSAADQYVISVKSAYANVENRIQTVKEQCDQYIANANAEAEKIRNIAEKESSEKLAATERECKKKYDLLQAQTNQFNAKVTQYLREYPELRSLFSKK